jgi:hypothetical protein
MSRMQRVVLNIVAVLGLITAPLHAIEMNQRQGLGPSEQAKVNNALARSYSLSNNPPGRVLAAPGSQPKGCGTTQIGTLTGGRNATRIENTVVARGDIITVNRNVRCP